MAEAFQPYGTIGAKWNALGAGGSAVGNPVRAEEAATAGGRFQEFQNGMIIWHPNVAWMVHGAILDAYRSTGSEEQWGFPIMDEGDAQAAPDGTTGKYQKFDNALILWSPDTNAHIVHGKIGEYFEANGNEAQLGYPTSDETAEGNGFLQHYQQGTIHWNPTNGASWAAAG